MSYRMPPPTRLEIIQHEVGHWIAAKELGFTVGEIQIDLRLEANGMSTSGCSNIKIFAAATTHEAALNLVRNRSICLMAGVAAQVMELEDIDWDDIQFYLDNNGSNDYAKIHEYFYWLANFKSDPPLTLENETEILSRELKDIWEATTALITSNKDRIVYLSNFIDKRISKLGKKVFPYDRLAEALAHFDKL